MSKRIKYAIIFLLVTFGLLVATVIYKFNTQGFYLYYEVEYKEDFVYTTGEKVWEKDLPPKYKIIDERDLYKNNNTYPVTYTLIQDDVTVYTTIDGKNYIRTNAFSMFFRIDYK